MRFSEARLSDARKICRPDKEEQRQEIGVTITSAAALSRCETPGTSKCSVSQSWRMLSRSFHASRNTVLSKIFFDHLKI